MGEGGFEGSWGDGGVGAENAEEGGHVGVDHAGAFGHACETVGDVRVGRESEGCAEEFGEGVCGADCAGGGEPGVVGVIEVGVTRGNFEEDLVDGETVVGYFSIVMSGNCCFMVLTAAQSHPCSSQAYSFPSHRPSRQSTRRPCLPYSSHLPVLPFL